ncbi:Uncharacterized protein PCOAH_00021810 [Plasmodium coatneyi]|uniref:Uncharacterized protein n=1 Tax=Plasmodium coatneyi TaxID=208452 RepID=A0A1B1DYY1_9APIC|nr:Uncharacterized protein PCOAH_00021810 [Plasmodium coatneyi]ANQ07819.1 Uncharacterized protein PCOAH_00021810 [Plasmodium coatneyi]
MVDSTNFIIVDNRSENKSISASCDNILDKNGNSIFKSYNPLYKLTYKHIYKYKRITCISTDVIYNENGDAYTPLYHYYYEDVGSPCSGQRGGVDAGAQTEEASGEVKEEPAEEVPAESATEPATEPTEEPHEQLSDADTDVDEATYNERAPKQKCLKYSLYELLLLRFLDVKGDTHDNNPEEGKIEYCFIKENKNNKPPVNKFNRDRFGPNNAMQMMTPGYTSNYGNHVNFASHSNFGGPLNASMNPNTGGIIPNYVKVRPSFSEEHYKNSKYHQGYTPHMGNNFNIRSFKNVDNSSYHLPENNLFIDNEGKMHLTGQEYFMTNQNHFHNKMGMNNKYDKDKRAFHFSNGGDLTGGRDTSLMHDFSIPQEQSSPFDHLRPHDHPERKKNQASEADRYWDNPSQYAKRNNNDIFTLGDIKKYWKNNEKAKNPNLMDQNNYSIFKDNDEENLAKSNFARWFKNSNTSNQEEHVDILSYVNGHNSSGVNIGDGRNGPRVSRNYEGGPIGSIGGANWGSGAKMDDGGLGVHPVGAPQTDQPQISSTVAELLMKQISILKERSNSEYADNRTHEDVPFDNTWHASTSNVGMSHLNSLASLNHAASANHIGGGHKELHPRDGGKGLLDIFRSSNSNRITNESPSFHLPRHGSRGNINNVNNLANLANASNIANIANMVNLANLANITSNEQYTRNQQKHYAENNTFPYGNLVADTVHNDHSNRSNNDMNSLDGILINRRPSHPFLQNSGSNVKMNSPSNTLGKKIHNGQNFAQLNNPNLEAFKNQGSLPPQGNINITPIINSLLRLDNDHTQGDNSGNVAYNLADNSIPESIKNAKVNNVLDSLKSLLKASKNGTTSGANNDMSFMSGMSGMPNIGSVGSVGSMGGPPLSANSKNFGSPKGGHHQNNKNANYHAQQMYPPQHMHQHCGPPMQDFYKKKFTKKDSLKYNFKHADVDITTNETIMVQRKDERKRKP